MIVTSILLLVVISIPLFQCCFISHGQKQKQPRRPALPSSPRIDPRGGAPAPFPVFSERNESRAPARRCRLPHPPLCVRRRAPCPLAIRTTSARIAATQRA